MKVKDLVCGMTVDAKTCKITSDYDGKKYYFCSEGCKMDFDRDPRQYSVRE